MKYNDWGEVVNDENTYEIIAKRLKNNDCVGIGWTDELSTHLDIIFKLGLECKEGMFQRGIRANYLFVSIIDYTSYAFIPDNIKLGGYIQEKLRMQNETGDKVAELINGIIECLIEVE